MDELIDKLKILSEKISKAILAVNLDAKILELKELEKKMQDQGFWADTKKAKVISKKANDLKEEIDKWQDLEKQTNDALEIALLDKKDKSVSMVEELNLKYDELKNLYDQYEFIMKFSQKYDKDDVLLTVFGGSGGTDAQDWAEMLLRMYLRFAEKKGFKTKIVEISKGQEAGIKRAVIEISGKYAYGYLKSEAGVHRLVRISPFDAEKMRHTSFALVEVLPLLEEMGEVEINPDDLRIDVFRAGGHGGQGVNKTESAVRIVHLPTNITAVCQSERSQLQNKETAMKILTSKLQKYFEEEKEEEKKKLKGEYTEASWGNQIRSYVLHPYKMVKDLRTGYETGDPESVLNGEIEGFVESYLMGKSPAFAEYSYGGHSKSLS